MRVPSIPIRVLRFVAMILILDCSDGLFKFKNFKCKCFEKSYCEFAKCELKILGRGIVALNVHLQGKQLPMKRVKVTTFRRFNGYRPSFYNISVDICDFFKHKKRFPFFNLMYDPLRNFSNFNHSCPYNHDIIINRMVLNDQMLNKLPVPMGFYKLLIVIATEGIWRGEIEFFFEVNLGYDR
ncbi:GL27208 [Drosophila persimilis]|uniref:GL27208 n=1 Tax=Drosophila persimilis TaxID=7234 RepID=B4GYZ8_DROPE|nr:GL27208 [Drosophila persimilis]